MPSREALHLATPWCPNDRAPLTYNRAEEAWECAACSYRTTEQSLVHRQTTDMRPKPVYRHRRADGWPYCPQCDEDELWSNATPATEDSIVGCYRGRGVSSTRSRSRTGHRAQDGERAER
jgi:hypothetical protein